MRGILGRFTRHKLSLADKHQMMLDAMSMMGSGMATEDVEKALVERGAGSDAPTITADALARFESEIKRTVPLPPSAREDANYYFILGVSPRATTEQIRRAYRRKAREVHPDQHNSDFGKEMWERLMLVVSDAHTVLSDPRTRRAYDIFWRERSRKVAVENRRKGELRGDWESRYRWDIALLSEVEEEIYVTLDRLAQGKPATPAELQALGERMETYESDILNIRTQAYSLPTQLQRFSDEVRQEMQRKDRLVQQLRKLSAWLPEATQPAGAAAMMPQVKEVITLMETVRRNQHEFDIRSARQ